MRVVIEVPEDIFWKAAVRAEQYDQRVDQWASDLVIAAACVSVPFEADPVQRLWRDGFTDGQIGRRLHMTNQAVGARRRRLGLPANRRPRAEWEAKEAVAA